MRGRGWSLALGGRGRRDRPCHFVSPVDFFVQAGGPSRARAQEVEPRTADMSGAKHFDLVDARRMQRDRALDTDPEGDLADGEHLREAVSADADDGPFEGLE